MNSLDRIRPIHMITVNHSQPLLISVGMCDLSFSWESEVKSVKIELIMRDEHMMWKNMRYNLDKS